MDIVEAAAEAIWQAESVRALGRERLVPWSENPGPEQEKYRFLARAVIPAVEREIAARLAEVEKERDELNVRLIEAEADAVVSREFTEKCRADALAAEAALEKAREALRETEQEILASEANEKRNSAGYLTDAALWARRALSTIRAALAAMEARDE